MNSRLSRRQERFIVILLASASILEAAERARVLVPTIYRWFKDPSFQTAHKQARQLMLNQAIQRLSALADSAVKVLEEMVHDVACSPHVKVTAVRLILENVVKIAESENFEQRVKNLEERLVSYYEQHSPPPRFPRAQRWLGDRCRAEYRRGEYRYGQIALLFMLVTRWADEIRMQAKLQRETKWHYINFPFKP
jgi:hypothetical protein